MAKKTWWSALLLATILLLLPVSSVFAATTTSGFTTWPAQTTTEVNKVWTILFNRPLMSTSVSSNTIYVKNSKQTKISTTVKLSTDGLTCRVTSTKAYTQGDYNLYITNVIKSLDGVKLSEQIMVPFTVVDTTPVVVDPSAVVDPLENQVILDVQNVFNSYVTDFTVKTASNVYRVDINKTKMQYIGKNTYNAGVFGAKPGSTIIFQAYDNNNKLIQTYSYKL